MLSRLLVPVLGGLALATLAACDTSPIQPNTAPEESLDPLAAAHAHHGPAARAPGAPAGAELAAIRRSTARYHRIEEALADGFVPLSACVAAPWGAMGIHYGHPGRIADPAVDPSSPEILLYEPTGNGKMRLVGVEFMVEGAAWYASGNETAPAVAGVTFDPPNPEHPDEHLRPFYTLHVWTWRSNPDGMFAPFNPKVACS